MKLSRKLIPAFIMLLVSAVLMSTASFAWFSTNTQAKAEGMTVKIAAAKTLLIKDSTEQDTAYATSKNYGESKLSMAPLSAVTPANATDGTIAVPTFWMVKQGAAGGILPNNAAFASDTEFETNTANYLTKTVNLRATGENNGENGVGKITMTLNATEAAEKAINDSMRVMVAVKNGNTVTWYRFAPFGGAAIKPIANYTASPSEGADKVTLATDNEVLTNVGAAVDIIPAATAETVYTVTYYIWFEGQDATCMANNATDLQNITVSLVFDLVETRVGE